MKKIQTLLLAACSFAGAAMANPGGSGVVILGDVLGSDGKPVSGSKLFITNVCTNQTTELGPDAAKGSFQYTGDPCGTYILEARANGYTSSGKVLEMGSEQTVVAVTLKLEAAKEEAKPEKKTPMQSFNPVKGSMGKKA
jgi:hypothetical protein